MSNKLQEKRRELRRQLVEQEARLKQDIEDIKQSVRPFTTLVGGGSAVINQLQTNPSVVGTGLRLATSLLPAVLRQDPRVRIALDWVLPLVVQNTPRMVDFFRRRRPRIRRVAVIGRVQNSVHRLRERLRQGAKDAPDGQADVDHPNFI